MNKYLIINADDFGMCNSQNLAVFELFEKGTITSATIMAPCKFAYNAVDFCNKHPQYYAGVHLTTTSEWQQYRWGPLSKNTDSLTDKNGYFYRSCTEFLNNANKQQVIKELKTQIEYLLSLGLKPSHIDNHMGSVYGIYNADFDLLKETITLAKEFGLAFRFPSKLHKNMFTNATLDIRIPKETVENILSDIANFARSLDVITPDYLIPGDWNGPQNESYNNYQEYMYELLRSFDNGVTETYIHPSYETDEIKSITPNWHRRVWEYQLFSDPKTLNHINALGIKLINYNDLKNMR